MEITQSNWQRVFAVRAGQLEEHLRHGAQWPVPGIVRGILDRRRRLRRTFYGFCVLHDQALFYTVMYLLPLLAFAVTAAGWNSTLALFVKQLWFQNISKSLG
jgi:hypothetical protein